MKASATKTATLYSLFRFAAWYGDAHFPFLQVTWQIATGKLDRLIAGHEAEEELEALKEEMSEAGDAMTPRSSNDSEHKER